MAIHQYIGARYVPKFYPNPNGTAEWLPNVIYEPLTIVTYGSNSYTSKKEVPASIGDPSNNPDYWVATGNYNAYTQELRDDLTAETTARENADDTLQDNIDAEATARENADDTLQDNIDAEATARENADNSIRLLHKNEVIVIGDSWSVHNDNMWTDYLDDLPSDYTVHVYAGGGYPVQTLASPNFGDLVTDAIAAKNVTIDPDKVKCIIFFGGVNDYKIDNAITNAVSLANRFVQLITQMKTAYPNARVITVLNAVYCISRAQVTFMSIVRQNLETTCECYYAGSWLPLSVIRSADFIHPTEYGSKLIAQKMINIICGSGVNANRTNQTIFDLTLTNGIKGKLKFEEVYVDDIPYINCIFVQTTAATTHTTGFNESFTVNRDGTTDNVNITSSPFTESFFDGDMSFNCKCPASFLDARSAVVSVFIGNVTLGSRNGVSSFKIFIFISDTSKITSNLAYRDGMLVAPFIE